ncbi:helix-turn-helix domain-containing protein [Alteromonas sp. ZYF713]|nr:helix-turn-helix domain-containing protein [Alteromonas sp. ZYF713]
MNTPLKSELVRNYKIILNDVINACPSGARQRLAEKLNKNRSFISQLTNIEYSTPIPAKHIPTIFEVCLFTQEQQDEFTAVYLKAHPKAEIPKQVDNASRQITLTVPMFNDRKKDQLLEKSLKEYVNSLAKLIKQL